MAICEQFKRACTTDPDFDVQTLPASSLAPGGGSSNALGGGINRAVVAVVAVAEKSCHNCATNCKTCNVKITLKTHVKSMFDSAAIPEARCKDEVASGDALDDNFSSSPNCYLIDELRLPQSNNSLGPFSEGGGEAANGGGIKSGTSDTSGARAGHERRESN